LLFGGRIWDFVWPNAPAFIDNILSLTAALFSMVVLAAATTFIYRTSCVQRKRVMDVLPGATITVVLWVVSSKIFGYFFAHYGQYSALYGSIAGVFILVLWLNLISLILLIGNEINSMLRVE
jgi:membrane protein